MVHYAWQRGDAIPGYPPRDDDTACTTARMIDFRLIRYNSRWYVQACLRLGPLRTPWQLMKHRDYRYSLDGALFDRIQSVDRDFFSLYSYPTKDAAAAAVRAILARRADDRALRERLGGRSYEALVHVDLVAAQPGAREEQPAASAEPPERSVLPRPASLPETNAEEALPAAPLRTYNVSLHLTCTREHAYARDRSDARRKLALSEQGVLSEMLLVAARSMAEATRFIIEVFAEAGLELEGSPAQPVYLKIQASRWTYGDAPQASVQWSPQERAAFVAALHQRIPFCWRARPDQATPADVAGEAEDPDETRPSGSAAR